jgi:glutamate-1-semialdehyde aminotransferase
MAEIKRGGDVQTLNLLQLALINHGVDFMRGHSGFLSSAHGQTEIDATVAAFGAALEDVCAVVDQQVA